MSDVLDAPADDTPQRERFAALLVERKALNHAFEPMQAEYDAARAPWKAIVDDADAKKGAARRKLDYAFGEAKAELDKLFAKFEPLANALVEHVRAEKTRLDEELFTLAGAITPRPREAGEAWSLVTTACSSTYRSQGFGAEGYARGSATLAAVDYLPWGIETDVRRIPWREKYKDNTEYKSLAKSDIVEFEVWAKCSPLDVEIVKRRPLPLRAQIKACWKSGANPRVFNPFLPPGYEESVGLDYFGGNLPGWDDEGKKLPKTEV